MNERHRLFWGAGLLLALALAVSQGPREQDETGQAISPQGPPAASQAAAGSKPEPGVPTEQAPASASASPPVPASPPAPNPADRVVEHRLANGLKILILRDSRAPVVTNQVWYRVGAMDEHSGITGLSHMLEHMMFKGSERYPPGEFSRIVASLGGRENAFTGQDFTGYYQLAGRAHWETLMEMEAERMHALKLADDEFQPERRVIVEERRLRTEDRPNALLGEQFMATAFFNHPYGHPIVGWMTDIQSYRIEDLRAWYQAFYSPDNAALVVVGDVDPAAVIAAAERHFGPIPARARPERKPRAETVQQGERRLTLRVPAQLPYLMLGWKAPALPTLEDPRDAYALILAAAVLDSGEAARLARGLVRERELAGSAAASYSPFSRDGELFALTAVPTAGTDIAVLERALLAEIERLRTEPIGADELQRVKAQAVASEIYKRDSIQSQAFELGLLETIGVGWRVGEDYVQRIREVTAEDIRRAVETYLIPDRLTVGILDPQPIGDGA